MIGCGSLRPAAGRFRLEARTLGPGSVNWISSPRRPQRQVSPFALEVPVLHRPGDDFRLRRAPFFPKRLHQQIHHVGERHLPTIVAGA